MNCREFKEKFRDKTLLAFVVVEDTTHIIKLHTDYITYFLRHFLDEHFILWRIVFFYEIFMDENPDLKGDIEDIGRLIREKAEYLHVMAKKDEQPLHACYLKTATYTPDLRKLEGKKHRLKELRLKKDG